MRPLISKLRRWIAAIVAIGALGQPALARADAVWKPNADDAVLFELRLGQYRLGDGVRGYQTPAGVCVDMADMVMALDLPVRVDKKLRRATGWIFNESRTLTLDRDANTVQIVNKTSKLPAGAIYDAPEGWCVATPQLSNWLGVALNPDLSNAILVIKSDTKLPVELSAERKARAAKIRPASTFDLKALPQSRVAYRGIKTPAVDANVSIGGLRERGHGAKTDVQFELYASGEAGPIAYDARLASNRKGVPESLRLRGYRYDPDGKLLGPLNATQIAIGDVLGLSSGLSAQSSIGRGAMISNRPLDRPENFDRTDFRGELPSGWDAELYRNGQLLNVALNRADGRYEFLDVPLLYGQNRFEIVLYGPQGQIRREQKILSVGPDSIPPRQTWYWAGINQDGRDLIGLPSGPQFGTDRWRGSFGLERGLSTRTSVSASYHNLFVKEVGRRNFVEAALRQAVGPVLAQLSGATDLKGGGVLSVHMLGELGRTYISAETTNVMGSFRSDRIQRGVQGLHRLSVDHGLKVGRSVMPVHAEARYTTRDNGHDTLEVGGRVSTSFSRYSITAEVDMRQDKRPVGPDPPMEVDTGILLNARIGRFRLRGDARFDVSPQSRFRSFGLITEWAGKGDGKNAAQWRADLSYDRMIDRARAGLGYARQFDRLSLSGNAEVATDGSVAASIGLTFSIGPNPTKKGGFRMTSARLATHGQVLARVFRDNNADGIRQPDEPLEPEVQLAAGRVPVDQLTDPNGETVIDSLEAFRPVLIGVDASSLPDPLVSPSGPGIVVTPRPGVIATVELGLTGAGEVDGTLVKAGGTSLEGVDLELVDARGIVMSRTRSDFDGYFLFERVPYGQYRLRIAKASADAARLHAGLAGDVQVSGKAPSLHLGVTAADPSDLRTAAAP